MPGAEHGVGSVVGAGTYRAARAQGAVCACPNPYSPISRPLCGEHKSNGEDMTGYTS